MPKPFGIFFSYFGSKGRMAKLYPEPKYGQIIEPFAGAAGYATRYHEKQVLLVDKSELVCGVWDYLIGASPEEIRGLPILTLEQTVDDLGPVPQEAKNFVGFWLTQSQTYSSKKCQSKAYGSGWTENIRERVARQVTEIRHWRIVCGSYESLDNLEATWFIDPPYVKAGKRYRERDVDYPYLADWCRTRSGQTIVCEQVGANWLPFSHLTTQKNGSNRDNPEAVWTSESPVDFLANL